MNNKKYDVIGTMLSKNFSLIWYNNVRMKCFIRFKKQKLNQLDKLVLDKRTIKEISSRLKWCTVSVMPLAKTPRNWSKRKKKPKMERKSNVGTLGLNFWFWMHFKHRYLHSKSYNVKLISHVPHNHQFHFFQTDISSKGVRIFFFFLKDPNE